MELNLDDLEFSFFSVFRIFFYIFEREKERVCMQVVVGVGWR